MAKGLVRCNSYRRCKKCDGYFLCPRTQYRGLVVRVSVSTLSVLLLLGILLVFAVK